MVSASQPSSFVSRYYSKREEEDRSLLLCGGLALTAIGLANRSLAGLLLAGIGAYVAYQNADSGQRFGQLEHDDASPGRPVLGDEVDQASDESFPASDPPAHSTTSIW